MEFAYQALIRLYCRTRGRSSRFLLSLLRKIYPVQSTLVGISEPLFPQLNDLSPVISDLQKKGYHVLEHKLPPEMVQSLLDFGLNHPATMRQGDSSGQAMIRHKVYSRSSPEAVRYDFSATDLLKLPVVQQILCDPLFINIARQYLQVEPIIDIVTMWWHTDFQKTPDSNAAQLYHFDMDRVRWLKFFFYITDVSENSGPHCFIEGTHQAQNIPLDLLQKGYVRITDDEINQTFPKEKVIRFTGPAGTIIVEDTAGLHKGQHVHEGDRLVFQIEFAVSMFGSPTVETFQAPRTILLQNAVKKVARVFQNFRLVN